MSALLGYTNYVTSGTVTANSAAALLPVTNLQNDQGAASVGWQTLVKTGILLTITAAARGLWRVVSLHRTNLTAAATGTMNLYTNPSTLVATLNWTGPVGGSGQVIGVFPQAYTADYATVTINDSTNPQLPNVALAYAGPTWTPASNLGLATSYGRDPTTDELVSRGGSEYPVPRFSRRRWDIDMQGVRTATELWPFLDAMMIVAASGSNLLLIPESSSVDIGKEATFGRLKPTADVKYNLGTSDRRSWAGTITERM